MKALFDQMKVFDPNLERTVVDIEIEKRIDFVEANLIVDDELDTEFITHRINHPAFESWLDANGYFEREETVNGSDTVTGEHVQRTTKHIIDYPIYLELYLCGQDIWDYLIAMGKIRNMKYAPE